jgi:hypothetical protein
MDAVERRRFDMLVRVRDFGLANAADFPAGSIGAANFAEINSVITELEESGEAQNSGMSAGKQGTKLKSIARAEIREQMRTINRTAHSMAIDIPGIEDKFRMPRGDNDQILLAAARAFASDGVPFKNQFVEYGLPAAFIDDLNEDITAFGVAVGDRNAAIDEHVGATAAIDAQIERGIIAVRRLRAIVPNRFRDNPAKLAAWTSASHVENAPQRKAPPQPVS